MPTPRRTPLLGLLLAVLCVVCFLATEAPSALADHSQVAILQDDTQLLSNPYGTMALARDLGVSTMRLAVRWQDLAPGANSFKAPIHFDAANPADYARSRWARLDAVVVAASQAGIQLDLDLAGGAPLWATGPGMPTRLRGYPFHTWKPSTSAFGKFVRAVATRYSGNYNPSTRRLDPGNSADLPRVRFWSVWNEPNYGPSLAPQAIPKSASIPYSPRVYRGLVDQAWSALHATGHGSDRLLFGELAPRGELGYGRFNMMAPLIFMRALYCVNSRYQRLRGGSAAAIGCPTTPHGSSSFPAHNPALFHAAGVSDHPYMRWYPPNREENVAQPKGFHQLKPSYATLATIGNLERGLRRMLGAYHSRRRLPVWMTEFAYITRPPDNGGPYPSPAQAAYYDNWAEYIAWRDPQIASFDQYVLRDPPKPHGRTHYGFPSGLIFAGGRRKPGYAAFRMPLYLPRTTASGPTASLEVWGAARPVQWEMVDQPGLAQSVTILFKRSGSSSFLPLAIEPIQSAEGYFDTRLSFPSSGAVEVRWTYPNGSLLAPAGTTVFSRTVDVKVK